MRRQFQIPEIRKAIEDNIENFKFREALKEVMNLVRLGTNILLILNRKVLRS